MRLGRPHRPTTSRSAVPMTPMIDVVFLLLIFFMVTSSFSEREDRLPSALAAEGRGADTQTLEPQIVRVRAAEANSARFEVGSNIARSRSELTSVLRTLPQEPGVIVRVDDDAPIWAAAAAMQAAADAGFQKRTYVPASR